MADNKRFLTIREAAKTGILSEHHLRLLEKENRLPGVYAGNRFKINYPLLLEQLDAESRKTVGGDQA